MGVKDQVMGNKNMAARSGNFGSAHAAQRLSAAANIFKNQTGWPDWAIYRQLGNLQIVSTTKFLPIATSRRLGL